MATIVEEVATKTEMLEIDPKSRIAPEEVKMENEQKANNACEMKSKSEDKAEATPKDKPTAENEPKTDAAADDKVEKEEKVGVEIEPKTGVAFPVKLSDGKQLNSFGMRKKTILGLGIKIYGFGIYADNAKLKELMGSKIGKASAKPTKEMYQVVIDSDVGMMVRMVIVFAGLTMSMVKKNFDEGLGGSIKKLNGGRKNEELTNKVMGEASDNIKLKPGSVIEITKLPGYILQTKVGEAVVSKVENELLCRAYFHMYLGEDAFDKEAKERFGVSLLSLF